MKNVRNGEIELIRFMLAFGVVLHHSGIKYFPYWGGYLGVDAFFIISGFFMSKEVLPIRDSVKESEIYSLSKQYIIKRIKSIFPFLLISSTIGYFVNIFCSFYKQGIVCVLKNLLLRLPLLFGDICFVQMIGLPSMSATGTIWYLCSLFFSLWLLYPLCLKKKNFISYYSLGVGIYILGLLTKLNGSFSYVTEYVGGLFNSGNLRAFAVMSIGLFCGWIDVQYGEYIKRLYSKRMTFFFIIFLYVMTILYKAILVPDLQGFDWIIVIIYGLIIICISNSNSFLSRWCDNKVTRFLGRLSVPLFMNHFYLISNYEILIEMGLPCSANEAKVIMIILSILVSMFVLFCERKVQDLLCQRKDY